MSFESTKNPFIAELQDLTTQEVGGMLLPVLVHGEAILDADVETIKKRAAMLLEADNTLSLEDALLSAAGDRLEARKGLAADHIVVIDQADGVVHSIQNKGEESRAIHDALRSTGRE